MARCEDCIHEKVCLHRANIQTDTYAYMGVTYDTEKCKHYSTADVAPKSEVEYNVNNHIYIKLTNYGKELIIKKYGYSYFEACVESNKQENGYYQLQCHKVMSYFGEHLYNGCKLPFEPTVYFDEAELKKKYTEEKK